MNNGRICIPVCARTAGETLREIRRAETLADVIEIRFDCLENGQTELLLAEIAKSKIGKPLLATFRSPEQGGYGNACRAERLAFWNQDFSGFWAVDVEQDIASEISVDTMKIASFHDFERTPDNLEEICWSLAASGSDVVKIAVAAADVTDAISVWELNAGEKPLIPIAMGEAGKWTRILGPAHGRLLTYASLDDGKGTADGQITAQEMLDIYRVKNLNKDTRVFGVIGDPVSSSLSPYMHNPAFSASNENAVFMHLQVTDLDQFLRRMVKAETSEVDLNFAGFSVTMPHKQAVMKYLDEIDPVAQKIGAVNTVKVDRDGRMTGYNTDAYGFLLPLKEHFGDLSKARAAVFGAGGASRACVYSLKEEGAKVTVFARDPKRAEALSRQFDVAVMPMSTFSDRSGTACDLVVDTTPLGMKGPFENESLLTSDELLGVRFVFDLVTSPGDTPLITAAKQAGIPAMGGIEMLIAQGAKQFEIWTGHEAPIALMRAAVLARLNR